MPEPATPATWSDARDAARHWLPATAGGMGLALLLVRALGPGPVAQAVGWLLVGFVLLPALFVVALGGACAVLTLLCATLAMPAVVRGRPTGLGVLCRELWRLPAGVLPGFCTALRRVRRPWLWGGLVGFVIGGCAPFAIRALRPELA